MRRPKSQRLTSPPGTPSYYAHVGPVAGVPLGGLAPFGVGCCAVLEKLSQNIFYFTICFFYPPSLPIACHRLDADVGGLGEGG